MNGHEEGTTKSGRDNPVREEGRTTPQRGEGAVTGEEDDGARVTGKRGQREPTTPALPPRQPLRHGGRVLDDGPDVAFPLLLVREGRELLIDECGVAELPEQNVRAVEDLKLSTPAEQQEKHMAHPPAT